MSGVYVGLDLSLSATGFYMIREGGDRFLEIRTNPSGFGSDVERCDYIAGKVMEAIGGEDVRLVAMEDYFVGRQPSAVVKLAVLGTMVRFRVLESGRQYVTFSPSQVKKFETGSGVAPKDNMLKSVFKRHGFDTQSNNIADACAIAHMCKAYCAWQDGERDFLKYEADVLKKTSVEGRLVRPYRKEAAGSQPYDEDSSLHFPRQK